MLYLKIFYFCVVLLCFASCKKFVTVDPPVNQLDVSKVFNNDKTAKAAVAEMYQSLEQSTVGTFFSSMDIIGSASADELIDYSDSAKAQQQRRDRKLQLHTGNSTPEYKENGTDGQKVYDEEIIREQLARNIAFLGEEAVEKIRKSFVIVVGIGGVGSAAGGYKDIELSSLSWSMMLIMLLYG